MNKTELITYLRAPQDITLEQLNELEKIVADSPYFLSARLLLAKASKELKDPKTKKRVASAAIYSTDRILLKKYLSDNLFFLSAPPEPGEDEEIEEVTQIKAAEIKSKKEFSKSPQPKDSEKRSIQIKSRSEETERKDRSQEKAKTHSRGSVTKTGKKVKPQPKIPEAPKKGELDSILEELDRDMENLKSSREKFVQVQEKIEEDDAVSEAIDKASDKAIAVSTKTESEVKTSKGDELINKSTAKTKEETEKKEVPEEVKDSVKDITQQILEAAKKVKEEVAKEIEEAEDSSSDDTEKAEELIAKEDKAVSSDKETSKKDEVDESKATKAGTKTEIDKPEKIQAKEEPSSKEQEEERAERVVREPRFSRFESRSSFAPPEDFDTSFLDEDDTPKEKTTSGMADEKPKERPESQKKEIKVEKPTPKAKDPKTGKKEASGSKMLTRDLSKAKPVARKRKVTKPKKAVPQSEAEDIKPKEKEVQPKASTKSSSTSKTSEPKSPPNKTTAVKKTSVKKTSKAKSSNTRSETEKKDKKDDDKSDRKSQAEIIDKFIKESPTIKYQRKEESSAEDLAETSASWDPNLSSEYLAEIFLHQGNKKRTIEIYEALSLKYPEKKSYFADLISKIK